MKLSRVKIQNFRSVREIELDFTRSCQILLGINETGKSNIIEALALLSPSREITRDDLRRFPIGEPNSQAAEVLFVFAFDDEDRQQIHDRVSALIGGDVASLQIPIDDAVLSLGQLVDKVATEVLVEVDVRDLSRSDTVWNKSWNGPLDQQWVLPDGLDPDTEVHLHDGTIKAVRDFTLLQQSAVQFDEEPSWSLVRADHVVDMVHDTMLRVLREQRPECIFWSYRNDDSLPASVDWDSFVANPKAYPALKNMFDLAGASNVRKAVEHAEGETVGLHRLLRRIGEITTTRLRESWKGFKNLSIELAKHGDALETLIKDEKEEYGFSQRSDGFRRFVSFLLMISARATSGSLAGALLLYDEPDTSLHPSGARQLREELLRLSSDNLVVYSTHSIFMVDPDDVERHLIVNKVEEQTTIKRATFGKLRDEEVLYNAVGYSVYDVLKRRNIILEGWRDKKLVELALSRSSEECQEFFRQVGICHSRGVSKIPSVAPMVEMLGRPFLIVTDGDPAATKSREDVDSRWPWKTYVELTSERRVTAEDLVARPAIEAALAEAASESPELEAIARLDWDKPFMSQAEGCLRKKGMDTKAQKAALNIFKERLFSTITADDLVSDALDLVEGTMSVLKQQEAD